MIGKPALEAESERADNPLYGQLLSSQLPRNQSLSAVLTRLTGNPQARWAGIGLGLVMAAIILIVGWRVNTRARNPHLVCRCGVDAVDSAGLVGALFHAALAAFDGADCGGHGPERSCQPDGSRAHALAIFAILALALAGSRAAQSYGPLCWGTLALWVALVVCARAGRTSSIQRE